VRFQPIDQLYFKQAVKELNIAALSVGLTKLPQWGLGQSPSRQTAWCILESKSAALVAAVFVDFPKKKRNFLRKNKLDIVRRVQFLTGRRPMRSFSPGAVATVALWKSASMIITACFIVVEVKQFLQIAEITSSKQYS